MSHRSSLDTFLDLVSPRDMRESADGLMQGLPGAGARVSRRGFLSAVLGIAGASFIGCQSQQQPPLPALLPYHYFAYHNVASAYHQQQSNSLSRQGYRPISLSLYGNPTHPQYAAVWLMRAGPAWVAFHDVQAAQFQQMSRLWARHGYRPVLLTATGVRSKAVFAGVFEQDNTPFLVKYDLSSSGQDNIFDSPPKDPTTVQYWQNWANDNHYILRWGAIYGDEAYPLYAGIWEKDTRQVSWNWFSAFDEAPDLFQKRLQAEAQQWVRPAFIALTPNQHTWSVFRDDEIGQWLACNNLTTRAYEAQEAESKRHGYYPLVVQGSGNGNNARFAAIFARHDQPAGRQWTITGPKVPGLAAFNVIIKQFMQQNAIRGGALAIARQGKLMFAHGYTWAEADYPLTQPTSLFRTASCTKPFTSIAIHQLIERGLLSLETSIQQVLKLTTANGRPPHDPRFNRIRIWHLLSHAGGWDRGAAFDPLFDDTAIAQALRISLPITKYQMATFMAAQPLQFDPGSKAVYSNFGYNLLGQVIEKLTGVSYQQALHQNVYTPLGLTRPQLARSLFSQRATGEVRYHARYPFIAPSVMSPDQAIVPAIYGGTNEELGDADGGQLMAACDYARMLAAFDLGAANPLLHPSTASLMWSEPSALAGSNILRGWFKGTLAHGLSAIGHNGDDIGCTTMAFRRSDNISFVVFFNHDFGISLPIDGTGNGLSNTLSAAADSIAAWPQVDLFPQVAIPAF